MDFEGVTHGRVKSIRRVWTKIVIHRSCAWHTLHPLATSLSKKYVFFLEETQIFISNSSGWQRNGYSSFSKWCVKNNTFHEYANFRHQSLMHESMSYMKVKCLKVRHISPKMPIVILNTVKGLAFKIYFFDFQGFKISSSCIYF